MVQAVVQSLNGGETVTCCDVIEVDDFYLETFGDGIVNHIRTSARNCDKYFLLHHSFADTLADNSVRPTHYITHKGDSPHDWL